MDASAVLIEQLRPTDDIYNGNSETIRRSLCTKNMIALHTMLFDSGMQLTLRRRQLPAAVGSQPRIA